MSLLVRAWSSVLLAPIAWSASLVGMFWLTDPVCQGSSRALIFATGAVCAMLALASAGIARGALRRVAAHEADDFRTFLLRMAAWSGLIFTLVIVLSLVPVAMLTPCPV